MSEQKTIKGKLTSVDLGGLTVEEYAKKALGDNHELNYHKSYAEKLSEESEDFFYNKNLNTLYKATFEEIDPFYFFEHHKNEDGSIDFITSFYNGGTYLEELITENIHHP